MVLVLLKMLDLLDCHLPVQAVAERLGHNAKSAGTDNLLNQITFRNGAPGSELCFAELRLRLLTTKLALSFAILRLFRSVRGLKGAHFDSVHLFIHRAR